MTSPTSNLQRVRRSTHLFALIAIVVGLIGLSGELRTLEPRTVVIATVVAGLGLAASAWQWSGLFESSAAEKRSLRHQLLLSQVMKYLPLGGFAQAATQLVGQDDDGSDLSGRSRALAASSCVLLAAGVVTGAGVLLHDEPRSISKWLAIAFLPLALTITPPGIDLINRLLLRAARLRGFQLITLPTRRLITTLLLSLVNFICVGTSFWLIARTFDVGVSFPLVLSAFALAWVAGFLVFPIPGGLGIREGVLLWTLPMFELRQLVVAALLHRAVTLLAELVLLSVSAAMRVLLRPPRGVKSAGND